MEFPYRRQFLHLAASAAALPALSPLAWAQAYPTRPVRLIVPIARIIVGLAPGGTPIKTGKLRALAVAGATRSEVLPDITTIGDTVPGYEASAVYGFGAPRNTPAEIIDKLNREINAGLADPKIRTRLADLGGTVLVGSPADFGKLIADESEKWDKVNRATKIKAE